MSNIRIEQNQPSNLSNNMAVKEALIIEDAYCDILDYTYDVIVRVGATHVLIENACDRTAIILERADFEAIAAYVRGEK